MLPNQLRRVAERATIGIGRNGTPGGNSSGDIFLAFSVANPMTRSEMANPGRALQYTPDSSFDPIYLAVVEATEEAVINALLAAEDMPTAKPAGKICRAIPHRALLEVMQHYGRTASAEGIGAPDAPELRTRRSP
jgi:D-aminopeptidase